MHGSPNCSPEFCQRETDPRQRETRPSSERDTAAQFLADDFSEHGSQVTAALGVDPALAQKPEVPRGGSVGEPDLLRGCLAIEDALTAVSELHRDHAHGKIGIELVWIQFEQRLEHLVHERVCQP